METFQKENKKKLKLELEDFKEEIQFEKKIKIIKFRNKICSFNGKIKEKQNSYKKRITDIKKATEGFLKLFAVLNIFILFIFLFCDILNLRLGHFAIIFLSFPFCILIVFYLFRGLKILQKKIQLGNNK